MGMAAPSPAGLDVARFWPRGFEILGFPCDQFGHQEPGSDVEIERMLKSLIVGIVDLCTQHPWWLIGPAAVLAAGSGVYAGTHFAIRTHTKMPLFAHLASRQ